MGSARLAVKSVGHADVVFLCPVHSFKYFLSTDLIGIK